MTTDEARHIAKTTKSNDFRIEFDYDFDRHDGLNDKKTYTIAELCGEEEE